MSHATSHFKCCLVSILNTCERHHRCLHPPSFPLYFFQSRILQRRKHGMAFRRNFLETSLSNLLKISVLCCREDLTAAKVIPDVISGIDPAPGVALKIQYGDTPITTKGGRLPRPETLNAPSVQVRSSAQPPCISCCFLPLQFPYLTKGIVHV